jgi:hypothetical protein
MFARAIERIPLAEGWRPAHISAGWIVLSPGGAVAIAGDVVIPLIVPLSGDATVAPELEGGRLVVRDPGARQTVVWTALVT